MGRYSHMLLAKAWVRCSLVYWDRLFLFVRVWLLLWPCFPEGYRLSWSHCMLHFEQIVIMRPPTTRNQQRASRLTSAVCMMRFYGHRVLCPERGPGTQ